LPCIYTSAFAHSSERVTVPALKLVRHETSLHSLR
jgi:hypothetical protein